MSGLPQVPANRFEDWSLIVRSDKTYLCRRGRRMVVREVAARHGLEPGVFQVVSISRRVCVVRAPGGLAQVSI